MRRRTDGGDGGSAGWRVLTPGHPGVRGAWLSVLLPVFALLGGCADGPEPTSPPSSGANALSTASSHGSSSTFLVEVTATDLGTLGGEYSAANDVSESGVVVGGSTLSGGLTHAFKWSKATGMSDLSPIVTRAVHARATGVNASGQISGVVEDPAGSRDLPVVWDGGTRKVLPGTDPDLNPNGIARDVNDAGVVTGSIELAGCVWTSFTTDCQRLTGPETEDFTPHRGNAINEKTDYQVVGRGFSLAASMLWEDFDDITIPAGDFGVFNSEALGLNDQRDVDVVGWASTQPPTLEKHAYIWSESGGTTDLGTLGGDDSRAFDVSDERVVVGWARDSEGRQRPFIWGPDIGMRDLGTLGGDEGRAMALNSSNQVVGASETSSGETHATLWAVTLVRIVSIDIQPGTEPNAVSTKSRGVLPVAVLTTEDFDAARVEPGSVTLGDGEAPEASVARRGGQRMASLQDVDDDGDEDLVLHVETQALVENGDLDGSTEELELNGETADGSPIRGTDAVEPVGGRRAEAPDAVTGGT